MVCGDVVDSTSHATNDVGLRRDFCVTRNTPETEPSLMVLGIKCKKDRKCRVGNKFTSTADRPSRSEDNAYSHGKKVELSSVPPGKGFCSVNDAYSSRLSRMCVAEKATPKNSNQNQATFLN